MTPEGVADSIADAAAVRPHAASDATSTRATRDFESPPIIPLAAVARENAAADVLDKRRSSRAGGAIDVASLASVLLAANRVVTFATSDDGYTRSWRPNPSAGGRHPIDILVDAADVDGLDAGCYWFDAFRWSLRLTSELPELTSARRAVQAATDAENRPGAILFLVASFERTGSRYDHPASLVWRDAGALMAVLQLAATGAGLSSCPAATAGLLAPDDGSVDVGAVILGSGERP